MKDIRPIRTEADYDWALGELEAYEISEPALGTPEGDRFDVLVTLLEAYEAIHWPIESPDPIDMIRGVLEMKGMTTSDFGNLLGSVPRASEILNRRRALTMDMAYRIHKELGIPAEVLLAPYHLNRKTRSAA